MKNEIYNFFVMAIKGTLFVIIWTIILCALFFLTYFCVKVFVKSMVTWLLR